MFLFGVASNFNEGLTYSYIAIEFVLLIIIWIERTHKEVRITYVPFFVFIVVQHLLMYGSNDWPWWKIIIDAISNYSS